MQRDGTVRTSADGARAAAVLARAFDDDPVYRWLLGEQRALGPPLRAIFDGFVASALRKADARVMLADDDLAAAIWLPPGGWRAPTLDVVRSAPTLVRALRGGLVRSLRLLRAVEAHHPDVPHWYLEAVGTVPNARRRGIAARLVRAVLDECDARRTPAYLENSNPANALFYERLGFVAADPLALPAGCPPIVPMWREPAAS